LLFGTNTRHIENAEAWLLSLDRLGLVSHRAVLIDMLTVLQNVAMPLTLEIEPIAEDMRPQVESLAREAGISESLWDRALGKVDPETQLRVRLARAIAPQPSLIIAEHPSVALPRDSVPRLAEHIAEVARRRQAALLTLTADPEWVNRVGGEVLTLSPSTGELAPGGSFMQRFKRVFGGG
jgi:ABC-type lipoprotein export system ATPase subunit